MKKLFYVLIFSFICHFSDAGAATVAEAEKKCRSVMRYPQVSISFSYNKLRYDHSKNSRTLARLSKRSGRPVTPGHQVNGLATYDFEMNLDFTVAKDVLSDGIVCLFPEKVILRFELKDPVIYLSRNLKPNSCLYNIALRHEQTHQQITTEVVEHYLPIIRERFLNTVENHSLVSSVDDVNLELARDSLRQRYLSVINPLIDEIQNEINREQSKLDSSENYEYEASLCE